MRKYFKFYYYGFVNLANTFTAYFFEIILLISFFSTLSIMKLKSRFQIYLFVIKYTPIVTFIVYPIDSRIFIY